MKTSLLTAIALCFVSLEVTAQIAITGLVSSKEGGVANVLVSDGYTITSTDETGRFAFDGNPKASFVFITVPATYEVPTRYGLPQHYLPLKGSGEYKFSLKPRKSIAEKSVVFVTGDQHFSSKSQAERWDMGIVTDMRKLQKSYPKGCDFYLINLGDIVWRAPSMFDDYNRIVATLSFPVFNVMGHADADHTTDNKELARRQFETRYGPRYYGFEIGATHFIVLDDNVITGKATYTADIDDEQMMWLKQYLSYIPQGSRVVVCLHIPTMRRRSAPDNLPCTKRLHSLLKPYETHFFSAHTHWLENYKPMGRFEHVHPAACGVYWDSHEYCKDGTPIGYGVYEFTADGKMASYYKSDGYNLNYQFRVYNVGEHPEYPNSVIANIWNWVDTWEVNWYEDGILMGSMERIYNYDYTYKWNFYHKSSNTFRDPVKVYHLFQATPSPQAKEIRIEALDANGKSYIKDIKLRK